MPRSSRHKSSKHSSRDAREYSDSEKESSLKEKRGREDGGSGSSSRYPKDMTSGEKRKLDTKSSVVSKETSNAEYNDEFGSGVSSSSKKRKEKVVEDRWGGGDDGLDHETLKSEMKEKEPVRASGDSKRSTRRDVNRVSGFDVEEEKKSGSKSESKHHRSDRKDRGEKERGSERERKGNKSDRSERLVDVVSVSENAGSEGNRKQSSTGKERGRKHSAGKTDYDAQEEIRNPEQERDLDRRVGRKRDESGVAVVADADDRGRSSREEISKPGRHHNDDHKDERNKDRFLDDVDKDIWCQDEKKKDSRSTRDYIGGKSDDKHLRSDKDVHLSQKISKPHGGEYDRELDRDRERYRELDRDRERYRDNDRVRGRDKDRERSRIELDRDRERDDREHDLVHDRDQEDLERVHDRDRDFDRNRDHGRERYRRDLRDRIGVRDHDRGRERDFDHDHDYSAHVDEKSSRYRDERGRRRSPDNYDGYQADKLRRVETEVDKERSLSRKTNVDSGTRSSGRRDSPSSKGYVGADNYREGIQDESKSLRDTIMRDSIENVPKHESGEKRAKLDDSRTGELSAKSPNTTILPAGVKERSPSTANFDHSRFSRRNTRSSLEADDAERRSGSIDIRDASVTGDRQARDLPSKNSLGEEYPPAESPFYHRTGQSNVSSHSPGSSVFRTRSDSPSFAGSFGDQNRGPGGRYRRSVDPNVGRGPSAWNGVHNWPSPLPNGYMPFPPGPPGPHHGGFPPIMPQFPPFFGVRPNLDMNHQGIPYHLADGDRLGGHVRPIGWPNMAEGSLPHFHGWDAGNSVHRNDPLMYGPGHLAQRRDMNMDEWKQNGHMNTEIMSESQKDVPAIKAFTDEASSAHGASRHNVENSCLDDQATSFKDASSDLSPMKETPLTPTKVTTDKSPESSGVDDNARSKCAYLLKLDISMDLVDPELYDQCNLAVKRVCEYVEDEAVLEFIEDNADVESEIRNLTVDVKVFPAAKESIFQRAMGLYKAQIREENISVVPTGDKICNTSSSQQELEQPIIEKEKIDISADCSIEQEELIPVIPEEIVPEKEEEKPELALNACNEIQMPVFDAEKTEAESPLDSNTGNACNEIQMPVFDAEKTEAESPLDSNTGNADIDSTYLGLINSNPNKDDVVDEDDGKIDDGVSGPLNICNDSVKECEGLIPVSDESESVVLSRIQLAPESTH